jgi:hypothetical protein
MKAQFCPFLPIPEKGLVFEGFQVSPIGSSGCSSTYNLNVTTKKKGQATYV